MRKTKAETKVSIDFPTETDAEAMARALIPEITTSRTTRALVRVTRRRKVTEIAFYAKDLVALRAMVNSFLRFAVTYRRLSETLSMGRRRAAQARRTHCPEVG